MKVKNKSIIGLYEAMTGLVDENLPAATAFSIAKGIRDARGQLEIYETQRKALIDKYAKRDEKGELVYEKDNPSAVVVDEKFWTEFEALQEQTDAEFDAIDMVSLGSVSPRKIMGLMPILKDVKQEE